MKTIFSALIVSALLLPLAIATAGQASIKAGGAYQGDQGAPQSAERRKKRVKGGSGCDDADDVREHAVRSSRLLERRFVEAVVGNERLRLATDERRQQRVVGEDGCNQ